jgi:hypothetical protein
MNRISDAEKLMGSVADYREAAAVTPTRASRW